MLLLKKEEDRGKERIESHCTVTTYEKIRIQRSRIEIPKIEKIKDKDLKIKI